MDAIPIIAKTSPEDVRLYWRIIVLIPALAVAFTAFCVWLTVRVINRRERWAKWTLAVTMLLPVLYVASVGPAARCATSQLIQVDTFVDLYLPVFRVTGKSVAASKLLNWYLWMWTDGKITVNG